MAFESIDSYVNVPTNDSHIYKDECAFTMAAPDDENGVYICLKNFFAVSPSLVKAYANASGNKIFLHYRIVKVLQPKDTVDGEPTAQPTKLAIGVPGGFELPHDRYTVEEHWSLVRFPEGEKLEVPCPSSDGGTPNLNHLKDLALSDKVKSCISKVQCTESAIMATERAGAAAAWESENPCPISKYAENLIQTEAGIKIPPKGHKCAKCDLTTNLWLNLSDGHIACGRRFWDGTGGNNHAIDHYNETGYPLAVKLGTITATTAEVYSYAEDEMVTDPHLAQHLAHFGINTRLMEKTDKTMTELEIAANERLGEWLTLQESDKTLQPLYGPGLTGIVNLGNTCYINSVLQVLFAIPQFRWCYANAWQKITGDAMQNTAQLPVDNFGLQFAKVGNALCSGAYSWPPPSTPSNESEPKLVPKHPGIRPRLFKHLMGKNHAEFASKRQQDVQEFLSFLFSMIESDTTNRPSLKVAPDSHDSARTVSSPLEALRFVIEDRLQCGTTGKVSYTERQEYLLSLAIPLSAATNIAEVEAFEERQKAAKEANIPFKETPVPLKISFDDCLSNWASTETISGFRSPATEPPLQETVAYRSSRLVNFPDFLCVQMLKFSVDANWVPCKLNVAIQLDSENKQQQDKLAADDNFRPSDDWLLDLSALKARGGLQPGEEAMPDASPEAAAPTNVTADEAIVSQLMEMGFSRNACVRACVVTANAGVEAAMGWVMEHMDDPDFNDPPPTCMESSRSVSGSTVTADLSAVAALMEMGFTQQQATRALTYCDNDLSRAADLAFSEPHKLDMPPPNAEENFAPQVNASASTVPKPPPSANLSNGDSRYELIGMISHMGNSTTPATTVCHIKRSALSKGVPGVAAACEPSPSEGPNEWVIFNDEKVARSECPPFQHAYLYVFRRVDAPRE
ncbi:hypothetical protein AAHC03_022762 [Spirometra sp. Aus1]